MTIEDNKKYKLTGGQIKDLASRFGVLSGEIGDLSDLTTTDKTNLVAAINEAAAGGGGGGITELTSADYDYPTDNPNRVLLGNLPAGIYYRSNSVDVGVRTELLSSNQNFFIIMRSSGSTRVYANILGQSGSANGGIYQDLQVWAINGTSGSLLEKSGALSTENLTQSTGTSTTSVMSQNATTNAINAISQSGAGAPTTATVGAVGQLYQDTTNGKLYICTDTTGGTYTWEEVGAGGGSGPTVVQTTGTSITDVMSQKATTSMVFASPSSKTQVQIGNGANAAANTGNATVAIGNSAKAYQSGGDGSSAIYPTAVGPEAVAKGNRSLALGANSSATYTGSVAVGAGANATSVGQFDIGTQYDSYGYNSSNYRLLTGVYDPQSAHDAATKGYVDGLVGNIAAALNAINNGGGN